MTLLTPILAFMSSLQPSGFGHVVKQMPRVLRDFFLNQAVLVRNETLLNSTLMSENPNFDG